MNGLRDRLFNGTFLRWGLAGIALVSPLIAISIISQSFDYELRNIEKPIIPFVFLLMAAGAIYVLVICRLKHVILDKATLRWVILLGLVARIIMFISTPILEDDYYRYLWDGGVLANGFNPYRYSPQDILDEKVRDIPGELRRLATDAVPVLQRINYPRLRTIYPPVAESAFAVAHIIRPWSMTAWRAVLLALDLGTLYLLLQILRRLNLPLIGLVIYWWNPLLIKEIYNSGHMDVVIFPFILGALMFSMKQRYALASGTLGMAVGVKFWPAVLMPVILRPLLSKPKHLVPAVLVFACVSTVTFLPFLEAGLGPDSGFGTYSSHWEMNDALFMLILWVVKFLLKALSLDAFSAETGTRVLVSGMLLLWIIWILRFDHKNSAEISRRFLPVIASLFLLSPTQFPWYSLWILPFLAMYFRLSLSLLTVLLPLYYMRFYLHARGMVNIHDVGVVWLEFVPVWCLLIWEWRRGRKDALQKEEETA